MIFEETSEFRKELKALGKKWRSLPDDLEKLTRVIRLLYVSADGVTPEEFRKGFFATKKAAVLQSVSEIVEVVKVRLDCRSLGSKDMIRITYIRKEKRIILLEIYAKNDKNREDIVRIRKYLKALET
jgi:hypothetical protein